MLEWTITVNDPTPPIDAADDDERWMRLALDEAHAAHARGDWPTGAVLVRDGRLLGRGANRQVTRGDVTAHAEPEALRDAFAAHGPDAARGATLYCTMEPCPMCAGAILNSRIRRVVYGAADAKAGCCGSVTDLFALPFNHHPMVEQGLRAEEAGALLQAFFKDLRVRLAARPKWKRPAPPAENMKKP